MKYICYIKSVLWIVGKHLSYIEDAWCLRRGGATQSTFSFGGGVLTISVFETYIKSCRLKLKMFCACILKQTIFLIYWNSNSKPIAETESSCKTPRISSVSCRTIFQSQCISKCIRMPYQLHCLCTICFY